MNKETKIVAAITALLPISTAIALAFWLPNHIDKVASLAKTYPTVAPALIVFWRILSIIIPPIPGAIVSFSLIPVFGWFLSFVYAAIGIVIGQIIAFALARKFREPLVKRFVPLQTLHKWETKLSSQTEFLAFLGIRLATGYIADFISYAAGLSKISFKKFLAATLIVLPLDAVLYWAGGKVYEASPYVAAASLVGAVILFYTLQKSKIFEKIK